MRLCDPLCHSMDVVDDRRPAARSGDAQPTELGPGSTMSAMVGRVHGEAGVDQAGADQFVGRIKKLSHVLDESRVIGEIGLFSGLMDISGLGYEEPVLAAGTDGGPGLLLADRFSTPDSVRRYSARSITP